MVHERARPQVEVPFGSIAAFEGLLAPTEQVVRDPVLTLGETDEFGSLNFDSDGPEQQRPDKPPGDRARDVRP
jgi:hypothetical protein